MDERQEERKKREEQKAKNFLRTNALKSVEEEYGAPPPYSAHQTPNAASDGTSSFNTTSNPSVVPSDPSVQQLDFTPSPLELPTHAECIAHLKLLHAFAKLRHEVGNYNGLFGIELEKPEDVKEKIDASMEKVTASDVHQPQGVHGQTSSTAGEGQSTDFEAQTLAERIREKRWTVFVTKAVDRFEKWWDMLPSASSVFTSPIQTTDFDAFENIRSPKLFPEVGEGLGNRITDQMPPLDVLMVWHAYMLNPRAYLEDCMRANKHKLWRTPFPWQLIHDSIDSATFEYNPPQSSIDQFEKPSLLSWNWRDDHKLKLINCPRCNSQVTVPYTRPPMVDSKGAGSSDDIGVYLFNDTGYAGSGFKDKCHECNLDITHDTLRVGKFIADANALWIYKSPLPGTILSYDKGVPDVAGKNKRIGTHDPFFPNRVVEKIHELQPMQLQTVVDQISIGWLKSRFAHVMTKQEKTMLVNWDQHNRKKLYKASRIAVRKVLGHYWDNSSPFGLDLVGAVLRQGIFVQKMFKIDWIHSPAAITTMHRSIVKYHRFVRMAADNPNRVAVPTLDIDLAWHTHQLTPKVYYRYTVAETKKFLNHDDKIPESNLNLAFRWISSEYEKKYGQPYSECACWYCECTREPFRSSFTNRLRSPSCDVKGMSEKGFPKDPVSGPHISAHNALVMNTTTNEQKRRRDLEYLDLQYIQVCKRYQKQKKKRSSSPPSRDSRAYVYDPYGYPMYYPMYVPYYVDPTCDGSTNACTGVGGFGAGGCVPGTCTDSATLGSCAGGSGTPSCSASCGGNGQAIGGCGGCGGGGGGCGGGGCGGS